MKDYLEYMGYDINSPREALKKSFSMELISDGDAWLQALIDRNLTVHTYDEVTANEVYKTIKTHYFSLLNDFYTLMKEK